MQIEVTHGFPPDTTKKIMEKALADVQKPAFFHKVRELVRHLAETNKHPVLGKLSEIAAVDQYIQKNVRYTRDPVNIELVHEPLTMLERIEKYGRWSEDCESIAGLCLTMLLCLGHVCRLTIVGFAEPGRYTHIFTEVYVAPFGWLIVDPSAGSPQAIDRMSDRIKTWMHFYPQNLTPSGKLNR